MILTLLHGPTFPEASSIENLASAPGVLSQVEGDEERMDERPFERAGGKVHPVDARCGNEDPIPLS